MDLKQFRVTKLARASRYITAAEATVKIKVRKSKIPFCSKWQKIRVYRLADGVWRYVGSNIPINEPKLDALFFDWVRRYADRF